MLGYPRAQLDLKGLIGWPLISFTSQLKPSVLIYSQRRLLGPPQWRIQGGGGVQGVRTPPLGHDVGFLTLGPKLDPPPPFLLVDLRCSGGSCG